MWNIVKHRANEIDDDGQPHQVAHPAQNGFQESHLFGYPVGQNPHHEKTKQDKYYIRCHTAKCLSCFPFNAVLSIYVH